MKGKVESIRIKIWYVREIKVRYTFLLSYWLKNPLNFYGCGTCYCHVCKLLGTNAVYMREKKKWTWMSYLYTLMTIPGFTIFNGQFSLASSYEPEPW